MKTFRIAVCLNHFDPDRGGLEKITGEIAQYLAGIGHDIQVVCFAGLDLPGLTVHRIGACEGVLQRAHRMNAAIRGLAVDLVYDTGSTTEADVLHPFTGSRLHNLERDLAARPWYKRLRLLASPAFRQWRSQLVELEQLQFSRARRVIATSGLVRQSLLARHAIGEDAIQLVPNGVDLESHPARLDPAVRTQVRERWGTGERCLFVVLAHNFHLKGVDTTIAALSLLGNRKNSVQVVISGHDPAAVRYRRRVRALGLSHCLTITGTMERRALLELMGAADVLLHPTHYDAGSLATLEGLACGLPVITTAANGAADFVSPGVSGLVLPDSRDPRALARAMEALLEPAARQALQPGVDAVRPRLDRRHTLSRIHEILQECATKP